MNEAFNLEALLIMFGSAFLSDDIHHLKALLIMLISAFLSATVFPANSEIIFTTLAIHLEKEALFLLWLMATLGNGLGGLTGYYLGRFILPKETPKFKSAKCFLEQYGTIILWFSWLPIIGDLLPIGAGWLRLSFFKSAFWIFMGKASRYGLILWGLNVFGF